MHLVHTIPQVISLVVGLFFVSIAVFLKENEERHLINLIEKWWLRIEDKSKYASTVHLKILFKSFVLTNALLDDLFGQRVLSYQFFIASTALSISSCFMTLYIGEICHWGLSIELLEYLLPFLALFVLVLLQNRYRFIIYINTGISIVAIWFMGQSIFFTSAQLTILFLLSFLTDLWLIFLQRKFLRQAIESFTISNVSRLLLLGVLISILFYIAILLPNETKNRFEILHLEWMPLFVASNFLSGAPIALVIVSIIIFVLHHLFWPIIIRPIYALNRFGIFKYRKTLAGAGVVLCFFSVSGNFPHLIKALFKLVGLEL